MSEIEVIKPNNIIKKDLKMKKDIKKKGKEKKDIKHDDSITDDFHVKIKGLSNEMIETMKVSQDIQLQQIKLIASRNGTDFEDLTEKINQEKEKLDILTSKLKKKSEPIEILEVKEVEQSVEGSEDKENEELPDSEQSEKSPDSDLSQSDESNEIKSEEETKLGNQKTSRGLKRKHVPSPLNISTASAPKIIHSAPLVSRFRLKQTPKTAQFPQFTQPIAGPITGPITGPPSSSQTVFQTYLTPHKSSPYKRKYVQNHLHPKFVQVTPQSARPYPQTPLNDEQQSDYIEEQDIMNDLRTPNQTIPVVSSQPTKVNKVVDVFVNDKFKYAPFQSQPLSSQREYFNKKINDRTPVSDDEIREMEEKYKSGESKKKLPSIQSLPIPNQYRLNPLSGPLSAPLINPNRPTQNPGELVGSINFLNSINYNFKIFNHDQKQDKEKFLRICEKIWDEFSNRD